MVSIEILNARSVRALCLEPGQGVLDVGSRLGQLSRAIARQVCPEGVVIGIERDVAQIEEARSQARTGGEEELVEFRQGLVEDLPLQPD